MYEIIMLISIPNAMKTLQKNGKNKCLSVDRNVLNKTVAKEIKLSVNTTYYP